MYTLPSNGRDGADRGRINTALALQPSSRDYTDHGNLSWLEEGLYHGFMVFHLSEGVGKEFLIGTLSVQESFLYHPLCFVQRVFIRDTRAASTDAILRGKFPQPRARSDGSTFHKGSHT